VTATAGTGSVALSGSSIPANGSCTVTVTVTSTTAGSYVNTLAAGRGGVDQCAAECGTGDRDARRQPVCSADRRQGVQIRRRSSLDRHRVLDNHASQSERCGGSTGVGVADNLPGRHRGMRRLPNAATDVRRHGGRRPRGVASTVTLANGTIPANGNCTRTVTVTSNAVGNYTNTMAAGAVHVDQRSGKRGTRVGHAGGQRVPRTDRDQGVQPSSDPGRANVGADGHV